MKSIPEDLVAQALFISKVEGIPLERTPPLCCGGGPQWGHDWDCSEISD